MPARRQAVRPRRRRRRDEAAATAGGDARTMPPARRREAPARPPADDMTRREHSHDLLEPPPCASRGRGRRPRTLREAVAKPRLGAPGWPSADSAAPRPLVGGGGWRAASASAWGSPSNGSLVPGRVIATLVSSVARLLPLWRSGSGARLDVPARAPVPRRDLVHVRSAKIAKRAHLAMLRAQREERGRAARRGGVAGPSSDAERLDAGSRCGGEPASRRRRCGRR